MLKYSLKINCFKNNIELYDLLLCNQKDPISLIRDYVANRVAKHSLRFVEDSHVSGIT